MRQIPKEFRANSVEIDGRERERIRVTPLGLCLSVKLRTKNPKS